MESVQMESVAVAAGFDSMVHGQLLERRHRLEHARTRIGATTTFRVC